MQLTALCYSVIYSGECFYLTKSMVNSSSAIRIKPLISSLTLILFDKLLRSLTPDFICPHGLLWPAPDGRPAETELISSQHNCNSSILEYNSNKNGTIELHTSRIECLDAGHKPFPWIRSYVKLGGEAWAERFWVVLWPAAPALTPDYMKNCSRDSALSPSELLDQTRHFLWNPQRPHFR